jgi:hypothetical protein
MKGNRGHALMTIVLRGGEWLACTSWCTRWGSTWQRIAFCPEAVLDLVVKRKSQNPYRMQLVALLIRIITTMFVCKCVRACAQWCSVRDARFTEIKSRWPWKELEYSIKIMKHKRTWHNMVDREHPGSVILINFAEQSTIWEAKQKLSLYRNSP